MNLSQLSEALKGKKTYLLGILGALALALWNLDAALHDHLTTSDVIETAWLSNQMWVSILSFFGFTAGMALRAGVAKGR